MDNNINSRGGKATSHEELLWRIDERQAAMQEQFRKLSDDIRNSNIQVNLRIDKVQDNLADQIHQVEATMEGKIIAAEQKVAKLEEKMERDYVKHETFKLVRLIVFGLVGLILVAVGSALITSVVPGG